MPEDLVELKALSDKIWECRTVSSRVYGSHEICDVARRLTSKERKFLFKTIVKHNLIVDLYTAGNQGVGMTLRMPDISLGLPEYPGVEFHPKDTTPVLNLWEDHFFDDEPITYKFSSWCKAHGTNAVARAYKFFRAFADLPHNVTLMERYNFKEPYIIPVERCHY